MKAVVVRQPWATLIALGVKTIETRPGPPNGPMRPDGVRGLPGCRLERGERIAIVAGAASPGNLGPLCDYRVGIASDGPAQHVDEDCDCPDPDDGQWSPECSALNNWSHALLRDERAHGFSVAAPLPLGAVVCTVVVADALPIVDDLGAPGDPFPRLCNVGVRGLRLMRYLVHPSETITDQLPLGDFTPGRWGWMLTDPRACEPIPCKGRQGVFELPADVAGTIA